MTKPKKLALVQTENLTREVKVIDNLERAQPRKVAVAIVEDDAELLSALAELIDTDLEFEVLGRYGTTAAAIQGIPRLNPDIVIMDINLPDISGVECVRQLKELCPHPQILMHTVYEDTEAVFSALRAGATGYLLKQTPIDELLAALRLIHRGGSPMSSHIARKVVQTLRQSSVANSEVESLSMREQEVLNLVAQGCLYKEIAEKLGVSFGTINTYSRRIYEKLHVHSRAQAVAKWNQG
jgi:DNA-binding NarL/FixJ family response regulator